MFLLVRQASRESLKKTGEQAETMQKTMSRIEGGLMREIIRRSLFIACLALGAIVAVHAFPAHAFVCSEVRLISASGVIGPVQSYQFTARCEWSATESKDSFSYKGFSSKSTNYLVTIDVSGKGQWDRKTGAAKESLNIKGDGATKDASGPFSGKRVATGTCNEDPFLKDPPGGSAVCQGMNVQYKSAGGPIYQMMVSPKRFLVEKRISLVEAQALSAKKTAGAPPPPPPKPQPKKEPLKIGDARGAAKTMKAAPGPLAAIAKPNLAVVSHQAILEPNCQNPKPALTAKLTIRNNGGPLSANKGTVYVKEFGGANLGSAGVPLPALGPGQQQTLSLPIITLQPYSSLAGQHKIQVILNPDMDGGQPSFVHPATPYVMIATFPSDHCRSLTRQPAGPARGAAPARGGVPPPPPPPSGLQKR
jgi:hypothetical protein